MNRNLIDRKSEYPEFKKLTDLIDKTIDFGTQIFKWDVEANHEKESVVCQTFFKNILEIGDGISILIQKSSVENAKILLRSLIENLLYLEYLLDDNSRNRALAYLVTTFHLEMTLTAKADRSNEAGKNFRNKVLKDKTYQNAPFLELRVHIDKDKDVFGKLLNHPDFVEIEKEYQRVAVKRQNHPWHSLFNGPANIEQLASHLNRQALYEILYRILSESVHSNNAIKYSLSDFDNGPGLGGLRKPEDADMIASLTLICLEMAYRNFVEKRVPAKLPDYEVWHLGFSKDYAILFN